MTLNKALIDDAAATVEASAAGYIGVGWAYRDKTFDFILPHEDGVAFDGNVHSPLNHKQRFVHDVIRHAPELLPYKGVHTYLPRYRVYWHKEGRHNVVVGWEPLVNLPKFQHHLTQLYKLVKPSFSTEDHYNGMAWGPGVAMGIETLHHWE